MKSQRRLGDILLLFLGLLLLAALIYALALYLSGVHLANAPGDVLPWAFAVIGLLALIGWWWERSKNATVAQDLENERQRFEERHQKREGDLAKLREDLESLREREEKNRRDREQLESSLEKRGEELRRERYLRSRVEEARRTEKNWNQELQAEIMRTYREGGALAGTGDVPSIVLRLARTLLEAKKGLLFSRHDGGEGLELSASEGFEHDPSDSAIARRFGEEVLERDSTIREDEPEKPKGGQSSPSDEEIENLVAIPVYIQDEFDSVVVCANRSGGFEDYEDEVLLSLGDHVGAVLENGRLQGELRSAYLSSVGLLAQAMAVKDPFLRGHSEDVANCVAAVADRLGFEPRHREELIFASLLHDVGKIGISERILLKPTGLTSEEFDVIKLHPHIGCRLVEQVPALRPIALSILHHHERFDGGGYPSGLRGEEIPLGARIICVADSFSAMTSERPYQRRMSVEKACPELMRNAGTQFDPEIVRIFVEEVRRNPPSARPAIPDDPKVEYGLKDREPLLGYGPTAVLDNLTLLYTHRYCHEVAAAEAQRAALKDGQLAVILVELTKISELNRRKGYAAGDEAIKVVARAVQRAATPIDATVCRHGGSRLALIAPGADELLAAKIAADIVEDLAGTSDVGVGFAAWLPGETGDDLIDRAYARLKETPDIF